MSYPIESGRDISLGATLTVRIPETEVDRKALYTVQADPPGFALPFRHQNVDGCVELTYIIGAKNKLQYAFGSRDPQAYAALWFGMLRPLLDCDDWFMNPFSFVLQTEHLYCDKNDGTISYVYIPSMKACSDEDDLKRMAVEVAQNCPSDDPDLEIKALRAIMQDFNPKQFLRLLNPYQVAEVPVGKAVYEQPAALRIDTPAPVAQITPVAPAPAVKEPARPAQADPAPVGSGAPDDIVIDLHGGNRDRGKPAEKGKAKTGGFFSSKSKPLKNQPPARQPDKDKAKGGLFGKKKVAPRPVIMGAAPVSPAPVASAPKGEPYPAPVGVGQVRFGVDSDVADGITQLDEIGVSRAESAARLRLTSNASLPKEIAVNCAPGKAFTIGRFDISVGRRQSDFEFDKSTKAVSRRHAAIERSERGYAIIDLSSSAGTFVNGQKITPNIPHELTFGTRVSFGTSDADYIWEE